MLPPEYLAGAPDKLCRLYAQVEQDILANMAERIAKYDYYIPAAQHQHQKLRAIGMLESDIEARLAGMSGKSMDEIQQLMQEAVKKSLTADAAIYAAAGMGPVDPFGVDNVKTILRAGAAQTGGLFANLTRTTANTATKQFEDALDRAWLQISTGGFDYNSAIRTAVKDLSRQGLGAITYPSGHVDTIEVAVRRAVVTGVNQTSAKAQLALMDELDMDLVETTAHAGARPDHQEWQGQVFSRSGKHPKYRDFVEATGYGTGAGLCGWNCRHSFYPFAEGSGKAYTRAMLDDYTAQKYTYNGQPMTEYEATQEQRYIERGIRRWKREEQAMGAAGQDTGEARAKVRAWQGRMRDFLSQTGLKRDGAREQIGGGGAKTAPVPVNNGMFPASLGGVSRGKPMSFREADNFKVNPKYGTAPGYAINCQSCVVTFEARLRGYDVYTLPNTSGSMLDKLSRQTNLAWKDPATGQHPNYIQDDSLTTPKKYLGFIQNTVQPGERYTLQFSWKGRRAGGHIVNLDRMEDGSLRIKDNQRGPGERDEWLGDNEVLDYLKRMKYTISVYGQKFSMVPRLLRIDNLEFDTGVVNQILKG